MESYTLNNIRRNANTNLYDLSQKTVANSTEINTVNHIVTPEQEMRMDIISRDIYGTTNYIEELKAINGILNEWSVKAGDTIKLFYLEDLNQLQWNEPEKNLNKTSLSNPNKNTQQDPNRLSPTDNPGIKPVVLDTKAKKITIMDRLS